MIEPTKPGATMHRQHTPDLSTTPTRAERRAQAGYDFLCALLIGVGLAAGLVYGWSV
jgi:hypothetical protein